MKKTLLALGVILAVAIACQVNDPETLPLTPSEVNSPPVLDDVFSVVEKPAAFPGGTEAWKTFIQENLKKSKIDTKGRVFASFIVDKAGALHNIELTRGIGGAADEAVLELLKKSPNWQVAKQRGQKVNSRMQVAITFE